MNNTQKNILIELLHPYLNKKKCFGCLVKYEGRYYQIIEDFGGTISCQGRDGTYEFHEGDYEVVGSLDIGSMILCLAKNGHFPFHDRGELMVNVGSDQFFFPLTPPETWNEETFEKVYQNILHLIAK